MSVTINGVVSPRRPSARGAALSALANVVGWFTITVALWAGLSGGVPLWAGALIAMAGVPAAGWDQPGQRTIRTTMRTTSRMSSSSMP